MKTIIEAANWLKAHDDFLIMTHRRPDGDAIGSAVALCLGLRELGKNAEIFPNTQFTEKFRPLWDGLLGSGDPNGKTVISVDMAAETMLPYNAPGMAGKMVFCMDHHGSNTGYAPDTFVDADAAACGELIWLTLAELGVTLSKKMAEAIYVAVSTDTGCFMYGNTNADALRAGAKLLELGVHNGELNKKLFRSMSLSRLKLEGLIYSTMHSYRNNTINIAVITQEMMAQAGADENDCDDLASLAGKVKGSVVAVTIRELPDGRCKASVRTNETVNASDICAEYGGGGHSMAAGCTMAAGPWDCAEKMLKAVEKHYK